MSVGKLPIGWSNLPLNDLRDQGLHTLVGGPFGSDLTTQDYISNGGVPVIRGTNLGGNESRFIDDGFVFVSHQKAEKLRRNMAFPGDVIFTQRGTLGQVAVIPLDSRFKEYVISQSQMKLTPNSSIVDSRYLYYYFRSPHALRKLLQETQATGVPHINLGILKRFPVVLPPLSEQKRIAEILDQAEALRAKRRAALALLDELAQSIFLDMFGDPVSNPKGWDDSKTLADVASIGSGITKGRRTIEPVRVVPYLAVVNVQDKMLDLSVVKTIEATEREIERYRLKKNDLLLTEGGDADKLGRGTLWAEELQECIHQNHIFRVRLEANDVSPIFLNWLIGGPRGKRYFLSQAKQTTGIATINMTQLKSFPMLIPSLKIQSEFASRIQHLEVLRSTHIRSLTELDQLFATLQHRAFRGQL